MSSLDPIVVLGQRIEQALVTAFGPDLSGTDPAIRRSDHADFQCNVALSLKKRVPGNPRQTAEKLVAALEVADVCDKVEIAGPGFLNLTLSSTFLSRLANAQRASERLGIERAVHADTVVIDYSAPNIAKEMHVGHLRSTIIGDCLARTLSFLGHHVIRQNHVGDWGTPFGMLIEHLIDAGEDSHDLGVGDLSGFYKEARKKFNEDPAFAERARHRVVSLQAGDERTLALWKRLVDQSIAYFQSVYDRLGVTLTPADMAGESLYNPMLAPIVQELEESGVARIDQGALCVYPPGFKGRDDAPMPLIVRKSDGGYGYATTDLAAVKYRSSTLKANRILYVVGAPQSQHLAMVYKAAALAGFLGANTRAEHVAFGSVLGEDGKILKSREGEAARLVDLLDEADERALAIVKEKNAERDEAIGEQELSDIAHAVGIAAIKYADLSADRMKDYVFSWSKMLATIGNTGPYLQYNHARTRSILRKASEDGGSGPGEINVQTKEERELVLALLGLPRVVHDVATSLEPHRLCTHIYEIANTYSSFFKACPVLKAEPAERASRLALCELSARALSQGLELLGIAAPQRM